MRSIELKVSVANTRSTFQKNNLLNGKHQLQQHVNTNIEFVLLIDLPLFVTKRDLNNRYVLSDVINKQTNKKKKRMPNNPIVNLALFLPTLL